MKTVKDDDAPIKWIFKGESGLDAIDLGMPGMDGMCCSGKIQNVRRIKDLNGPAQ